LGGVVVVLEILRDTIGSAVKINRSILFMATTFKTELSMAFPATTWSIIR
jgi:hypothetical protein